MKSFSPLSGLLAIFVLSISCVIADIQTHPSFEKATAEPYEVDKNLDDKWIMETHPSIKHWYIVMANKFNLLSGFYTPMHGENEASSGLEAKQGQELCPIFTHDYKDNTDHYHVYDSKTKLRVKLARKRHNFELRNGRFDWTYIFPNNTESGYAASVRWVLTDNKDYILETQTRKCGGVGFYLYTTKPNAVDMKEGSAVHNKLIELGFKKDNFVWFSHANENCPQLAEELEKLK